MNLFDKSQRLLTKSDYDQVFKQPRKIITADFIVFYRKNQLSYPRLGLALAKKKISKAHERNRIKRLVREAFRKKHDLPAVDMIFMAKCDLTERKNQDIFSTIGIVWGKLTGR